MNNETAMSLRELSSVCSRLSHKYRLPVHMDHILTEGSIYAGPDAPEGPTLHIRLDHFTAHPVISVRCVDGNTSQMPLEQAVDYLAMITLGYSESPKFNPTKQGQLRAMDHLFMLFRSILDDLY